MAELMSTRTVNNIVDELISVLLDTIIHLKDLLRKLDVSCNFVPISSTTTATSMQDIYQR